MIIGLPFPIDSSGTVNEMTRRRNTINVNLFNAFHTMFSSVSMLSSTVFSLVSTSLE